MSQVRVTDFFSQKKRGISAPQKQSRRLNSIGHRQGISTKLGVNGDSSHSVHAEFVRVIDEAVSQKNGESERGESGKTELSSPRTPKRSSTDGEFDLGAAVFSATASHSTAKKRRQVEVVGETTASTKEKKETQRRARKRLVLPQDSAQVKVGLVFELVVGA